MNAIVRCRTGPVGDVGALIPRLDQSIRVLHMHIAEHRGCPKGLNIDGLVILDMQNDGGVDGIEILQPLGSDLISTTIPPRAADRYWRLFVEPSDKQLVEREFELTMARADNIINLSFAHGEVDARYLIGPCVMALVGSNELRGLAIDMNGFR